MGTFRTTDGRGRRRLALTALAGLCGLGSLACTGPGPGPGTPTTSTTAPRPGNCRAGDFEQAAVRRVPTTGTWPRYELTVTGRTPSSNQTVSLVPAVYVRQPEYWAIEVVICNTSEIGLPVTTPYTATLDLTGHLGTQGIDVVGTNGHHQRIDVPEVGTPGQPDIAGSWRVTGVSGGITGGTIPLVEGSAISLVLAADRTVAGRACNSYGSTWTQEGSALRLGPVVATTMACLEPGVMDQEQRYFNALGQVRSARVEGRQLSLADERGLVVVTAVR